MVSWMSFVYLIPAVLSFVVLAAHFLHHGILLGVAISLLLPFLLFLRRSWVARGAQVVLVLAALEWIRTGWLIAQDRIAMEQDWSRMAIILGAVVLWNLGAALLFQTPRLRRRYGAAPALPAG